MAYTNDTLRNSITGRNTRKQIVKQVTKIAKLAKEVPVRGELTLRFSGCTLAVWDEVIASLSSDFVMYKHFVQINGGLTVILMLD